MNIYHTTLFEPSITVIATRVSDSHEDICMYMLYTVVKYSLC